MLSIRRGKYSMIDERISRSIFKTEKNKTNMEGKNIVRNKGITENVAIKY